MHGKTVTRDTRIDYRVVLDGCVRQILSNLPSYYVCKRPDNFVDYESVSSQAPSVTLLS